MGITISLSQLNKLDLEFLKGLAGRVFAELVDEHPGWMVGYTFDTEQSEIIKLIKNAEELEIQAEKDVVRFVGLAYAPARYRDDPMTASVITRTLNRLEWSAEKRLEFIYGQVVDNPKVAATLGA